MRCGAVSRGERIDRMDGWIVYDGQCPEDIKPPVGGVGSTKGNMTTSYELLGNE